MRIIANKRYFFEYHCWESEQSSDAELWHHTHQEILVLRKLSKQESDLPMYRVKFGDGLEYDVFADELLPLDKHYN